MSEKNNYLNLKILNENYKKRFLINLLKSKKNCVFKNKAGTKQFIRDFINNNNSIQQRIFKLKYILNEIFDKCQLEVIKDLIKKITNISPNNKAFNTFVKNLIRFELYSSGCERINKIDSILKSHPSIKSLKSILKISSNFPKRSSSIVRFRSNSGRNNLLSQLNGSLKPDGSQRIFRESHANYDPFTNSASSGLKSKSSIQPLQKFYKSSLSELNPKNILLETPLLSPPKRSLQHSFRKSPANYDPSTNIARSVLKSNPSTGHNKISTIRSLKQNRKQDLLETPLSMHEKQFKPSFRRESSIISSRKNYRTLLSGLNPNNSRNLLINIL
jgi:hypothetical protein